MLNAIDKGSTLNACNAGPDRDSPSGARQSLRGPVYCLAIILSTMVIHNPNAYAIQDNTYEYKAFASLLIANKVQMKCLDRLWTKESHWNPKANNPHSTAYGIPQILKMTERNPYRQIVIGVRYIEHRYKTPCQALKHHIKRGHY